MIEDNISLSLQDIAKISERLKGVKKDIKEEEKIVNDQYIDLKRASKDLKEQVKAFEEDFLADIKADDHYNKLRELRLKAEEDLAHANEKLLKLVEKMPQKPFQMQVETEDGTIKVDFLPGMQVFLNGKEKKLRKL